MGDPRLPPGLALSWGVLPTHRRGPKPGFTVAGIVAAAVELADLDGAAALSLPRVARRLGLTTSALYRYLRSKDELLVLMVDAGWGTPPATVGRARSWRTGAAAWTRGMIERIELHPWLLDVPVRGAPVTPNQLRWLETFLRTMSRSGLSTGQCVACALLLDGYARSAASLARDVGAAADAAGSADAVRDFLAPRLHDDGYPILAAMLDAGSYEDDGSGADVEFGLTRILDGIAELIADRAQRNPPANSR